MLSNRHPQIVKPITYQRYHNPGDKIPHCLICYIPMTFIYICHKVTLHLRHRCYLLMGYAPETPRQKKCRTIQRVVWHFSVLYRIRSREIIADFVAAYLNSYCRLFKKFHYYISKNSAAVIILGSVTPDSRKSLSPVSNTSALAFNAARNIGLSLTSRISFSTSSSISGVVATSMTDSKYARNFSSMEILVGNFRLKILHSSSIFFPLR